MRLGCLHAHHSNIPYIDGILDQAQFEPVHFVDPGLMRRIGHDPGFTGDQAREQVQRQLGWMAAGGLDAILITCTNYIATMSDETLALPIPVVKIDEPFFADICGQEAPQALVFTNPDTVAGTMRRLDQFASRMGSSPDFRVEIVEQTFELAMAGKTEEYAAAVSERLLALVQSGQYRAISVAQLSMVEAARRVTTATGMRIGQPLDPLRDRLAEFLAHKMPAESHR